MTLSKRVKFGRCSNCDDHPVELARCGSVYVCDTCATKYLSSRLPLNAQVAHAASETKRIQSQTRVVGVKQ